MVAGCVNGNNVIDINNCGVALNPTGLVFGGKESEVGKWPWLVALYLTKNDKYICGGTLLSSKLVSTVIHISCLLSIKTLNNPF